MPEESHDELARRLWRQAELNEAIRARDMPTEEDALRAMNDAYQRLRDLGWKEAQYCPKDGTVFASCHPASAAVAELTHYQGEWPKGTWWVEEAGDLWPHRPILFRPRKGAVTT